MARIAEDEIKRLKREVSIERLVEARGVKLKRHGADLVGLCPFHEDHSPSLVVSPEKNLWNCLGACGKGGSVIDWVMRAEGVSFRHAVELLKQQHLPLAARPAGPPPKKSTTVKLPPLAERSIDDQRLLESVVEHYHEALKQTPEAQQYLARRGLQSAEMVEQFRLGFANRTLGYGLPQKDRSTGAELRGRLQRLGIFRESGHEHFNGSVVIPIFNREGEVVQMYGRKITPGLRPGTPLHLYLPGPHRGVWNEMALVASKEIILCESLIDALTFWCAGFRHVTASYGVNGFTDDHRAAFQRYGTKKSLYRLRPGRRRRASGAISRRRTHGDGDRMLPGAVPEGHGRKRIRAQGDASGEESWRAFEQRDLARQRQAAHSGSDRTAEHPRKIRSSS